MLTHTLKGLSYPTDIVSLLLFSDLLSSWSRDFLLTAAVGCHWCSTVLSRDFWMLSDMQTTSDTSITASNVWVWMRHYCTAGTWTDWFVVQTAEVLHEQFFISTVSQASYYSDPIVLYSHIFSKGIGTRTAALYVAWAQQFEQKGMNDQADAVYQKALGNQAQPADTVLHEYW